MPVSTDDGYSSPKSEKDTDCGEDDDHDLEQNESVDAKKQSKRPTYCTHISMSVESHMRVLSTLECRAKSLEFVDYK